MLFFNNPEAVKAIVKGRRHDYGQRTSDILQATPTREINARINAARRTHRRFAPLVVANR